METKILEVRELDRRVHDKLDITLWWVRGTMDTYVEVIDYKQRPPATYNIPVEPPATASEVFHHPFSYLSDSPAIAFNPAEEYDGRAAE